MLKGVAAAVGVAVGQDLDDRESGRGTHDVGAVLEALVRAFVMACKGFPVGIPGKVGGLMLRDVIGKSSCLDMVPDESLITFWSMVEAAFVFANVIAARRGGVEQSYPSFPIIDKWGREVPSVADACRLVVTTREAEADDDVCFQWWALWADESRASIAGCVWPLDSVLLMNKGVRMSLEGWEFSLCRLFRPRPIVPAPCAFVVSPAQSEGVEALATPPVSPAKGDQCDAAEELPTPGKAEIDAWEEQPEAVDDAAEDANDAVPEAGSPLPRMVVVEVEDESLPEGHRILRVLMPEVICPRIGMMDDASSAAAEAFDEAECAKDVMEAAAAECVKTVVGAAVAAAVVSAAEAVVVEAAQEEGAECKRQHRGVLPACMSVEAEVKQGGFYFKDDLPGMTFSCELEEGVAEVAASEEKAGQQEATPGRASGKAKAKRARSDKENEKGQGGKRGVKRRRPGKLALGQSPGPSSPAACPCESEEGDARIERDLLRARRAVTACTAKLYALDARLSPEERGSTEHLAEYDVLASEMKKAKFEEYEVEQRADEWHKFRHQVGRCDGWQRDVDMASELYDSPRPFEPEPAQAEWEEIVEVTPKESLDAEAAGHLYQLVTRLKRTMDLYMICSSLKRQARSFRGKDDVFWGTLATGRALSLPRKYGSAQWGDLGDTQRESFQKVLLETHDLLSFVTPQMTMQEKNVFRYSAHGNDMLALLTRTMGAVMAVTLGGKCAAALSEEDKSFFARVL